MTEFITTFVITVVILLTISIYFLVKKSALKYIIPMIGLGISLLLIGFSFIVDDGWTGMAMGFNGFAIFIGSAVSFLIIAMITNMIELRKSVK